MSDSPCPGGNHNIGNDRRSCAVCNRFAQKLLRVSARKLGALHPDDYAQIREATRQQLYQDLIGGKP